MPRRITIPYLLLLPLLLLPLLRLTAAVRPFVLVITNDDIIKDYSSDSLPSESEWDDFSSLSASFVDPWLSILDPTSSDLTTSDELTSSLSDLITSFSTGDPAAASAAAAQIAAEAAAGLPAAQSVIGFLYGAGVLRKPDRARHFMYHSFAADGGDLHSKMALAYSYFRQEMYEKAVVLYAELAEAALTGFLMSKEPPVVEAVRLHSGTEENREALRKSRGEDDEDFQITEYQAQRGNAPAMYKLGLLYYYGLRGLRRDHTKARYWFSKAVEKGETRAMELMGEIYARGAGVERNYTKAFEWLSLAAKQHYSAYNGLGYLYVKGYGVEEKNLTKAKEYFHIAAEHKEPGGHYNLGVLYLKGLGVKRDVATACNLFLAAANAGQPKALYQVAKLFQKGIGLKKNLQMATLLFKTVAERGPWSSLSRWALEAYLKGDIGKALFLYSRMAELGYEVAQSNAAWILDRYGEQSMCMGESRGFCTDTERHLRAHSLWWQASEQGNEHAALLIGDAYYYGRGIERDYDRAAEAYLHAQSQSNAQAMFNLGYMHEHGQGLPLDLHLAKRYYDQALDVDSAAKLPVTLALLSLWVRKNYAGTFVVSFIDVLPDTYPRIQEWVEGILMDEGNATILTLLACLITVLYLRERQRRQAGVAANVQPPEGGLN